MCSSDLLIWEGNDAPDRAAVASLRASLSAPGVRALEVALSSIAALADRERFVEAAIRYARAVDLADELRREWDDHGRPKLYTASNGNLIPHPLIKMVREAESDAARFGKALKLDPASVKRSTTGRPPGSTSAADRKVLSPVIEVNADEDDA